jgi:hypothetical protein
MRPQEANAMAELISFDGVRRRVMESTPLPQRKAPKRQNQWDVRRIVGSVYGGKDPALVMRDEHLCPSELVRVIVDNSRPVDVTPLAISRKLRAA